MFLVGELDGDLIVKARRRAQARRAIVRPEGTDKCLLVGARGGRDDPVAAETFHFVVSGGVIGTGHGRRCGDTELIV